MGGMRERGCKRTPWSIRPGGSRPRAPLTWAVAAVVAGCGNSQRDAPAPETPEPEGVHGTAPPAVGGTPSVVLLRPAAGSGATAPGGNEPPGSPVMDQLGLVFTPTTLLVRVGERVLFTNSETLVHNVHVRFTDNDSTVLDVETDPGARFEFAFEREGGYDVTCEHHPGMRAFIYVTSAFHGVFADPDGDFVIAGVPPGDYALAIWSVDPNLRSEQPVRATEGSTEVIVGPS